MSLAAENIVASVVAILAAGGTVAGANVIGSPDLPVAEEQNAGSVIAVFEGDEETALDDATSNRKKRHWLQLFIECHLRAVVADPKNPRAVDTAANAFIAQVLVLIEADVTLGGTCLWFEHKSTKRERNSAEHSLRVVTLGLIVHYRTLRTNPSQLV